MEPWRDQPFDRSLKYESNYVVLINAVVYDGFRTSGTLEQLYRSDKLFASYERSYTVLNENVLSVVITFFNDGDEGFWQEIREEAILEHFIPFPDDCSPREFWEWDEDFRDFQRAKNIMKRKILDFPNACRITMNGYNIFEETFIDYCEEYLEGRVNFPKLLQQCPLIHIESQEQRELHF